MKMLRCKQCNDTTTRVFDGLCNKCLCREAVEEAEQEENMEGDISEYLDINTPLSPKEYEDVIINNEQLDWKSYLLHA